MLMRILMGSAAGAVLLKAAQATIAATRELEKQAMADLPRAVLCPRPEPAITACRPGP